MGASLPTEWGGALRAEDEPSSERFESHYRFTPTPGFDLARIPFAETTSVQRELWELLLFPKLRGLRVRDAVALCALAGLQVEGYEDQCPVKRSCYLTFEATVYMPPRADAIYADQSHAADAVVCGIEFYANRLIAGMNGIVKCVITEYSSEGDRTLDELPIHVRPENGVSVVDGTTQSVIVGVPIVDRTTQ